MCLLEAGGANDDWRIRTPGMMPFLPKQSNYRYDTVPQRGLNGRQGYQPRGKGLGGSSAINAMLYVRGHAWDYDHWATLGCDGWAYEDVLPVFRKSEANERGADHRHGADGPLHVSDQHWPNPGSVAFVAAAGELQLPINGDFNGATQEGFGIYQTTQKDGERWSASRAYLDPARGRPNLDVRTGQTVARLLIEDGRATGVVLSASDGGEDIVRAGGGVVLSAGAFNSPQLLMLSGIGPAAHLAEHGIGVVRDAPAVGSDLQDHVDYIDSFESADRTLIGDSLEGTLAMAKAAWLHLRTKSGAFTTPWAESGGFWKSRPDAPAPDVQYHFVPAMLEDHGRTKVKGHGFSLHSCVLRPESRGTVRLASTDPRAAPAIDPAFLTAEADMALLKAAVRMGRRVVEAPALARYDARPRKLTSLDDDGALETAIRGSADTIYHPIGTCRMGSDADAVVDPKLKAKGVDGLWIADASIMPRLVGGNTNAPSIMIGERAAGWVAEELG